MAATKGFTLVELMVTLAVMAVLYSLSFPIMSQWMTDSRIKVTAESIQTGILLARSEAIRQNALVRFQLTSSLDNSCVLSNTGTHWVVSLDDATAMCGTDPSATTAPRIIQIKSGQEGSGRTLVSATRGGATATSIVFNGAGRVSGLASIDTIEVTNPDGGTCQDVGGNARCLRIRILPGGDSRICDPKVVNINDVRRCL